METAPLCGREIQKNIRYKKTPGITINNEKKHRLSKNLFLVFTILNIFSIFSIFNFNNIFSF